MNVITNKELLSQIDELFEYHIKYNDIMDKIVSLYALKKPEMINAIDELIEMLRYDLSQKKSIGSVLGSAKAYVISKYGDQTFKIIFDAVMMRLKTT